jgi:PKD repeat protein
LTFTVTKANGCNDTRVYQVLNIGSPSVGIGSQGNTQGCAPFNLTFNLIGYENNDPSTIYTFCFGDDSPCLTFSFPPPPSITHTYTTSSCLSPGIGGQFTASIIAQNLCGTTAATLGGIQVYTYPNPNFQPDGIFNCAGVPITFYNNTLPGWDPGCNNQVLMMWDFGDGTVQGPAWYGYPYPNATHTYTAPGNYTVVLSVKNYCSSDWINYGLQITIDPGIINNTISANQSICVGDTPALLNGSVPQGGTGVYSYLWEQNTVSPGVWVPATGPNSGINYQPPALFVTTMYRRIVNSVPPVQCDSESLPVTITVNPSPTVTSPLQKFICSGVPVNYIPTADIPGTTFYWTAVNNSPGCITGVAPTSGTGTITHTVINTCSTLQTVSYFITPVGPVSPNCVGETKELVVEVNPQLLVSLTATSNPIGFHGTTTITANVTGGTSPFTYTWSGGSICSQPVPETIITCPLDFDTPYFVSVTDALGCTASGSIVITINSTTPCLIVSANPTPICIGGQSTLTATASCGSGNFTYQWYDDLGIPINPPGANIVTVSPVVTTTYTVTADDGFNLILNEAVTVVVDPSPHISSPLTWEICSQTSVAYTPQSDVPGTTFTWVSNNLVPGCITEIGGDWVGDIETLLINSCLTPQTITYTIIPTGPPPTYCPGIVQDVVVIVNPYAHVINVPLSQTIISGGCPVTVTLGASNSDVSPVFFEWSTTGNLNLSPPYNGPVNGIGDLTFNCPINITGTNDTEILDFTIVPVYNGIIIGCPGQPYIYSVIINNCLEIFDIIPNGTVCGETEILLSGAQIGVSYQLYRNSLIPIGSPLVGTGGPISFGIHSLAGTYTILATLETNPNCFALMNGSTIIEPLLAFSIIPQGINCPPINIFLSDSQIGVMYELLLDGNSLVPPVIVTGAGYMLSFGVQILPGTYTVRAFTTDPACEEMMEGSCVLCPYPQIFNITPQGISCADDNISIGLDGSEIGVIYQLYRDGILFISSIPGTGNPIDFGIQMIPGTYTILALNEFYSSTWMNGEVILANPPVIFMMEPQGLLWCTGTVVGLNGSQSGIEYTLIRNGIDIIATIVGDGIALDFGMINDPGIYTVIAYDPFTICDSEMNGEVLITPGPSIFDLVSPNGNDYCEGTDGVTLMLPNSETGAEYQLWMDSNPDIPVGTVQIGQNGTPLYWNNILEGSYYVVATYPDNPLCTATMNNLITVESNPLPIVYAGADATICENSTYQILDATANYYSEIYWTVLPIGIGSIVDPSIINTVFTPNIGTGGLVAKLILCTTGIGACSGYVICDTMNIYIEHLPEVYAGADFSICENSTYQMQPFIGYYSSVLWQPEEYFDDPTNPYATFLPPAVSSVTILPLTFNAFGMGACSEENVMGIISATIEPSPEVHAGGDTSFCETDPCYLEFAYTSNTSTIFWEVIIGNGILDDPTIQNPTYFPEPGDVGNTVTLGLYGIGIGNCASQIDCDTIDIYIIQAPEANFTFENTCVGQPIQFYDLSNPGGSDIVEWFWDFGDGDFSYNQNPEHIYSQPGAYLVVLTIYNVYGCADVFSQIITIYNLPVVTLEPFEPVCLTWPPFELSGGLPEGGDYSGDGVINNWFYPETAGLGSHIITYTYEDANGCDGSVIEAIWVDPCPGIPENKVQPEVLIYPNPNTGSFTVMLNLQSSEKFDLTVFNAFKEAVYEEKNISGENEFTKIINLNGCAPGLYYVMISGNNINTMKKIIIK